MALNTDKPVKLYYSIKEVAEMIGVNESTLRYWEKEFTFIKPKVTANKVRQYTEKDIEQIKVIYSLIKVKGFKIAAARKYLQQNRSGADKSSEVLDTLISVRDQLKDLKKQLAQNGVQPEQFISLNFENMSNAHLCTAVALHDDYFD